jgi:hypothetical protein
MSPSGGAAPKKRRSPPPGTSKFEKWAFAVLLGVSVPDSVNCVVARAAPGVGKEANTAGQHNFCASPVRSDHFERVRRGIFLA